MANEKAGVHLCCLHKSILAMEAQMAIKRAAEDAREEMAELLLWQQEQNKVDEDLRRKAAAERKRTAQKSAGGAAKPATTGTGSAAVWGGPKVNCMMCRKTWQPSVNTDQRNWRPAECYVTCRHSNWFAGGRLHH